MSDKQVPWAPGRRALVRCPHTERWHEAVARMEDERVWEISGLDDNGDPDGQWWVDEGVETSLLPGQCLRCFHVDTHASWCMVAANMTRGVPAFWAPWAMWTVPDEVPETVEVYALHQNKRLRLVHRHESGLAWLDLGHPLVALGPEGPTLAPWEKT